MTEKSTVKPPMWFWIIGVIALIYNGMGINAYLQQAYNTESFQAMYSAEQLELIATTPAWATAAFAIAVFAGFLGCVGLLLRKKWAKSLFLLSLLGILVQMIYNFFISKDLEVYGPEAYIVPLMVIIVGFLLIWFAKKGIAKGWLV